MAQMMNTDMWSFTGGHMNPLKYEKLLDSNPSDYVFCILANNQTWRDNYEKSLSLSGRNWGSMSTYHYIPVITGYDSINPIIARPTYEYDFCAILGHNFATAQFKHKLKVLGFDPTNGQYFQDGLDGTEYTNIINWNPNEDSSALYDGFSICDIRDFVPDSFTAGDGSTCYMNEVIALTVGYAQSAPTIDVKIGSFMTGSIFEFPKDCDVNVRLSYDYSVNKKIASNGRSYSYTQPNYSDLWIGEMAPWTLREQVIPDANGNMVGCTVENNDEMIYNGYATPTQWEGGKRPLDEMFGRQRNGARVWRMSFTHLKGQDIFPTNHATNTVGIGAQYVDVSSNSTGIYTNMNNTYTNDTNYDIDIWDLDYQRHRTFQSTVVEKTMNGAIPFIFQPVSDDYTPSGFCWAVLDGEPRYTQVAPNLWDMSITIREIL
tara:strand:- start:3684 stop:4976 length:1293 start_codon:yes stop_codon:yes gene_type:complete